MSILDFVCLGKENAALLDAFAPLIPASLLPRLKSGELLALGSLLADYPNGAAVFETAGERAILHSIFVDEYDRCHGTGSELIAELCTRLKELGGMYSLELRLPLKNDEAFLHFLRKNGFKLYNGEAYEAFVSLAALKELKLPEPKLQTVSGDRLDDAILRRLESELKSKELYLLEGRLSQPPVLRELCRYTIENGAVTAAAIVRDDGQLSLAFLYGQNSAALTSVLYDAREAVYKKYGGEKILYFDAVSEGGQKLAEKLLGKEKLRAREFALKSV